MPGVVELIYKATAMLSASQFTWDQLRSQTMLTITDWTPCPAFIIFKSISLAVMILCKLTVRSSSLLNVSPASTQYSRSSL